MDHVPCQLSLLLMLSHHMAPFRFWRGSWVNAWYMIKPKAIRQPLSRWWILRLHCQMHQSHGQPRSFHLAIMLGSGLHQRPTRLWLWTTGLSHHIQHLGTWRRKCLCRVLAHTQAAMPQHVRSIAHRHHWLTLCTSFVKQFTLSLVMVSHASPTCWLRRPPQAGKDVERFQRQIHLPFTTLSFDSVTHKQTNNRL